MINARSFCRLMVLAAALACGHFPACGQPVHAHESAATTQRADSPSSQPATQGDDKGDLKAGDDRKSADKKTDVVTRHSLMLNGKTINYTATAGSLSMKEENGKEKANIFFVAYTKDDVSDTSARPITYCFNGGPGSSSVWLHLGAFGPQRVDMGDAGSLKPPPWKMIDNEGTLLDLTDMVFIDPVTTGYSRAVPPEQDDQFHGFQEDIQSVGEFIRLYTTRVKRWNSPKFLAGESYGTTRAAGLAGYLQDRHGMFLNGIILISSILNFQTASFDRGNDLAYPLFLPTYTTTAAYHKKLDPALSADLPKTIQEVEQFALGEYTLALAKGSTLSKDESDRIAQKLSRYTGLSLEFVKRCNLRIGMGRFSKELLRDQRKTVGRLDSRFTGVDADAAGESASFDASYAAIQGPFTAALNHYVRADLGYESDLPYEILTSRVSPWNYGNVQNRYLNVAETLRGAITQNPNLRVFVAEGLYDFATPFFAAEYTFNHLGLDAPLDANVTRTQYEAGHMMYIHDASRTKLKTDLARFYEGMAH